MELADLVHPELTAAAHATTAVPQDWIFHDAPVFDRTGAENIAVNGDRIGARAGRALRRGRPG